MVEYDPETALVVVDVQNDFADPRGSLYVQGGEAVVAAVGAEILRAADAGAPVVYTADWHPPDTPHFAKDGGIWPVHCVAGTWGAEFHPALPVIGPVVHKGAGGEDGYSGFTMRHPVTGETVPTALAGLLREHRIARLVVVGLATDYCVAETALDGLAAGWEVIVPTGCVAAVDLQPGDGERALQRVAAAGGEVA